MMRFALPILCGALLLALAGCATQPHRARQHSRYFNTLDQPTQARLLQGNIQPGDDMRQVYIALGTPTRKDEVSLITVPYDERWTYLGEWVDRSDGTRQFQTTADFDLTRQLHMDEPTSLHVYFAEGRVSTIENAP